MKKYFYRIRRYIIFIFQVLFIEKPRGLDFTMFDTSALQKAAENFTVTARPEKNICVKFSIL